MSSSDALQLGLFIDSVAYRRLQQRLHNVLHDQNKPSRSVDATAQRGASDVATGSHFVWADLGGGQSFQ